MGTVLRIILIYLTVALVSGAIAYLGNQMGRHIGRRKMSVLGMRPRHTSIFITTLTGVGIALATLTLAGIISEPVRGLLRGTQKLEMRLAELERQIADREEILKGGNLIFGINQPIEIATVPAGLPADRLAEQLKIILSSANTNAIREFNRKALAAGQPLVNPENTILIDYNPQELSALAEDLSQRSGMIGVWVRAEQNMLYEEGGRLPVRFDVKPVELVFHEGEVLASRTVDPHSPTFVVEWYQFVEDIKQTALRRNMVESPGTGLGAELDLDSVVDRVEGERGPVLLEAVAKKDLYQTNSLDVEVLVRPGEQSALRGRVARR